MTCGDFKDLTRRTASGKILRDKAFNIAKNPKYDRYQRGLLLILLLQKLPVVLLKMKLCKIKS